MSRTVCWCIAIIFSGSVRVASCQIKTDTTYVRELIKKATTFLDTSPDSLLYYGKKSLEVSESIDDFKGIAMAHSIIGNYYWMKSDFASAIASYQKSFENYNRANYYVGAAKALSNFGMTYSLLGDYTKAVDYFLQSLTIAESANATAVMALTNNNLGLCYTAQMKYDEAIEALENAQVLAKEVGDYSTVAGTLTNLGSVYNHKNEFDKALVYHKKALNIFDSLKVIRGQMSCYNNIGELLLKQGFPLQAEEYHRKCLDMSKKQGLPLYEATSLADLGNVKLAVRDFRQSLAYFQSALDIAKEKRLLDIMVTVYKGISDSYRGLGRYNDAFDFLDKHMILKDSIFDQENVAKVSNLRLVYDLDKKDASIALLTRDNRIARMYRNMGYGIAAGLVLLIGMIIFYFRQKIQKDRRLMEQERMLHEARESIAQVELNNRIAREEELNRELDFRSRTLTTYTLNLIQKNAMLDEVKGIIQGMLRRPANADVELKKLVRLIDFSFTLDKDWEGFKMYFEHVHPDFFKNLKDNYPQLSPAELRLCALIRLSLSIKEAATILSISPESVKVARHRLRKKLNLTTDANLTELIMSIGSSGIIHEKSIAKTVPEQVFRNEN